MWIRGLPKEEIINLWPSLAVYEALDVEDLVAIFKACDAWWQRRKDAGPEHPHALLTSGNHSDGFVNCGKVFKYVNLAQILSQQLVTKLAKHTELVVDWVIGPAYGGITLAYEIASNLINEKGKFAKAGFVEKQNDKMVWAREQIDEGETVLFVEDVMTTGASVVKMVQAVKQSNKETFSQCKAMGVLVNRCGMIAIEYMKVVSLLEPQMTTWTPEECPLCALGSEVLKPKKEHWEKFVACGE